MTEKSYYAKVCKFYASTAVRSMAIEVKITKNGRLPFSALRPHQEEALLQSERSLAHKIPDVGVLKKPYDIILVHKAQAVLVVIFYKPRATTVYEIPVRNFIEVRQSPLYAKAKSMSEMTAKLIGHAIKI